MHLAYNSALGPGCIGLSIRKGLSRYFFKDIVMIRPQFSANQKLGFEINFIQVNKFFEKEQDLLLHFTKAIEH